MSPLNQRYQAVRDTTVALTGPLEPEDFVVQSMPDASPVKWHLAHTTWFFETFVLLPYLPGYRARCEAYAELFNSYYNGAGEQFERSRRGTLSRPGVQEILAWRRQVDVAVCDVLERRDPEVERLITIGMHHEQQHQELLVTDVKHALALNPVFSGLTEPAPKTPASELGWRSFGSGVVDAGHADSSFCFDNERPRHKTFVPSFQIADRPVSNREYLAFIDDGAYRRHELWLSDAWRWIGEAGVCAPLYWVSSGGRWLERTLAGVRPLELDAPVTHVSFFEADAFARWSGARLPTEFEWEHAARAGHTEANFLEDGHLHPALSSGAPTSLRGLFGGVWEWTSSAYRPYPGYTIPEGTLGEYNGKFMNGQYVLRGGSCATPRQHIRASYRNFFGPDKRWQFSGVRLAR